MFKLILIIYFIFSLNSLKADINSDVKDLKKEFEEIKGIYESKIEALEKKITSMEGNSKESKSAHSKESSNDHSGHEEHSDEDDGFNIEAVLNAKYTSYSKSGEAAIKGFGVAHEGERAREGLAIGETELIINNLVGVNDFLFLIQCSSNISTEKFFISSYYYDFLLLAIK
jgi:hypothetical protein